MEEVTLFHSMLQVSKYLSTTILCNVIAFIYFNKCITNIIYKLVRVALKDMVMDVIQILRITDFTIQAKNAHHLELMWLPQHQKKKLIGFMISISKFCYCI